MSTKLLEKAQADEAISAKNAQAERISEIDDEIATLKEQLNHVQGKKTEVYTRIVGYHRAVNAWNKGKKEEYTKRKLFKSGETNNEA